MNQLTDMVFRAKATTLVLAFATALIILVFGSRPLFGANEATVSATVTVQNISVAVSDGSVSYGTLGTNATEDTSTGGVNDSQTASNDGNITEDFNIRGQNTANWTLGATQGADQYFHKFCTSSCDASPTWTALTTSNQQIANAVGTSSNQVFDLQLGTPTSTSNFTQQSANVTIQAVAD